MAISKDVFPNPNDNDRITAYFPDIKGAFSHFIIADDPEWNEYLNDLRAAEILELGVVRVSPVPRQISPTIPFNVSSLLPSR